ncbi:MAG: peptidase U32 family protein [Bacteroidales bacterium]
MSRQKVKEIELLAPAKSADIGIEAILHGADAVYIGAPKFGARAAAGNSLEEIETLVNFAHSYHARVYVAMNTILTDDQLPEAQELAWDLYKIGVDALIIQDMGVLSLDLPPIELHASTQCDTRTPEKAQELSRAGFSQIVPARELTLEQIKDICKATDSRIEVFVHGALCVSYSGQCYISQALRQRSANRGSCAQFCRLPYDLVDSNGKILKSNKHLLSLKDLNRSERLEELLDAGVTSLKIEGRLKEMSYVKNIVAHYRQKLDQIFKRRSEFVAASLGLSTHTFKPNPSKSFSRGFTEYFDINGEDQHYNFETPKSIGEFVGTVKFVERGSFTVAGLTTLNNGDGLCVVNSDGSFTGFRANNVEGNRVYLSPESRHIEFFKGAKLYRNYDHEFEKSLTKSSAERKIEVNIQLSELPFGFALSMADNRGHRAEIVIEREKQTAQKPQQKNIIDQLGKLGNTQFIARQVDLNLSQEYFIPSSLLNEWRRMLVEKMTTTLKATRAVSMRDLRKSKEQKNSQQDTKELPKLTYLANVSNSAARNYYLATGYKSVDPAFEIEPLKDVPLMFMKHCIKHAIGHCPRVNKEASKLVEPLYLRTKNESLRLEFDCKKCEMRIYNDEENEQK